MITANDRELLEIVIDISQVIWKNDIESTPKLIERINSIELEPNQLSMITDAVGVESALDIKVIGERDAYLELVEGLNCVTNKAYLKKVRRLTRALEMRDLEMLRAIIDEAKAAENFLDPVENDAIYLTFLIRACLITRDYDSMEVIRNRLGENDGVR